jgi:hypothetical protein
VKSPFWPDEPGRRFQNLFQRHHRPGRNVLARILALLGGTLVLAAGVFFLFAPGPGVLVLLLGAGLIARESEAAARLLDRVEVRIRGWIAALR